MLHSRLHDEYLNGTVLEHLPASDRVASVRTFALLRVSNESPPALRHEAAEVARLATRESSAHKSGYDGSITDSVLLPYVLVHGSRAIGFVLIGETGWSWRMRWIAPNKATFVGATPDEVSRRVVARVWIAKAHRAQGLAREIVEAVASIESREVAEMTFQLPFSAAGCRLVQSLLPGHWFGAGDAFDFEDVVSSTAS